MTGVQTCALPIYLSWFFVSCSNQSFTVQMSSPHKCGQESDYSAFNMVVVVFPLIFFCFLPSFMFKRHIIISWASWKVPPAAGIQIRAMLAKFERDFLLGHSSRFLLQMRSYVGASNNYWHLLGQFSILG